MLSLRGGLRPFAGPAVGRLRADAEGRLVGGALARPSFSRLHIVPQVICDTISITIAPPLRGCLMLLLRPLPTAYYHHLVDCEEEEEASTAATAATTRRFCCCCCYEAPRVMLCPNTTTTWLTTATATAASVVFSAARANALLAVTALSPKP